MESGDASDGAERRSSRPRVTIQTRLVDPWARRKPLEAGFYFCPFSEDFANEHQVSRTALLATSVRYGKDPIGQFVEVTDHRGAKFMYRRHYEGDEHGGRIEVVN